MMVLIILSALMLLGCPFSVSHVANNFNECKMFFMDGQPPQIHDILKGVTSRDANRYKTICQSYEDVYRYATFYDIINRIPVFSAYKYTGKGDFKRKDIQPNWMIEPQLEQSKDMAEPFVKQSSYDDYKDNPEELSCGHLFPSCHAPDASTAKSTFTLTNIVPQYKSFNKDSWSEVEKNTTALMDEKCRKQTPGFVLTGAVPSSRKLKDRVNIPTMMWTAFCCLGRNNEWFSKAHWADNIDDGTRTIETKELKDLQQILNRVRDWGNVQLFKNNCHLKKDVRANVK